MWRPDQLLGEARRNLGPAHLILGVFVALAVAAVLSFVASQAIQALRQEAGRQAAGSLVWTATATDEAQPLAGASCTRLGGLPGVAAAGGVAATAPGPFSSFDGGRPLPVSGLTPGAIQVFVPAAAPATASLGADLAALGEVAPQQWLLDEGGARAQRLGVLVTSAPVGILTSGITVPVAADTPISTCWVRMEPGAYTAGRDLLGAAYPDGSATIAAFLPDATAVLTPAQQWRAAVGLQPWLIGAGVIAAAALLAWFTRRTDIAVYRTFGTTRPALTAMLLIESAAVGIPATAAGVLLASLTTAVTMSAGLPPQVWTIALTQSLAAAATGLAVGSCLSLLTLRGRLNETLRDR